jgi:hypothetical protein
MQTIKTSTEEGNLKKIMIVAISQIMENTEK